MNIPQAELDKLNNVNTNEIFGEHEEAEEEEVITEPIKQSKEEVSASTEEDAVADKARVPYSRFESVHERAIRAEERLALLEEQAAKLGTVESNEEPEMPQDWIELLGDSDAAKKAWQIQARLNERLLNEATEKAFDRIQSRDKEEKELVNSNLEAIEDSLNTFAESLGRSLTATEESSILDIQDEFTPKDADGKYLAPLLSPDKAYEIYELRSGQAKVAKSQAKNRVLSATGASSEGNVSNASANNNSLSWESYRDKI